MEVLVFGGVGFGRFIREFRLTSVALGFRNDFGVFRVGGVGVGAVVGGGFFIVLVREFSILFMLNVLGLRAGIFLVSSFSFFGRSRRGGLGWRWVREILKRRFVVLCGRV